MSPQFRPSLTYAPHEVQEVLEMKIKEEEAEVEKHSTPVTRKLEEDMLARISGRANTVKVASLFSGAGVWTLALNWQPLLQVWFDLLHTNYLRIRKSSKKP